METIEIQRKELNGAKPHAGWIKNGCTMHRVC